MGATIIFFISTAMFYGLAAYVVIKYGILDSWSQVFFTLVSVYGTVYGYSVGICWFGTRF